MSAVSVMVVVVAVVAVAVASAEAVVPSEAVVAIQNDRALDPSLLQAVPSSTKQTNQTSLTIPTSAPSCSQFEAVQLNCTNRLLLLGGMPA